jgi:cation/acetate symporter
MTAILAAGPGGAFVPTQARWPIIGFLALFVLVTLVALYIVYRNRRADSPSEFYLGGRRISAMQNGIALFGTYLFVSSFLTLTGQIALVGIDGFLFSAGFLVAWLTALFLFAEPVANTGKFTLGDVLAIRGRNIPVRRASAIVTFVLFACYVAIQTRLAGGLIGTLLGINSALVEGVFIAILGVLTIGYVYFGGMAGVTKVAVIKSVVLLAVVLASAGILLARYGGNVSALLGDGVRKSGPFGPAFLNTGPAFGANTTEKLGFVSKLLTLICGQAILPFLFMRYAAVRTARKARRSFAWAAGLIAPYYLAAILTGFGITAVLGGHAVTSEEQRNQATPLLANTIGGIPLLAVLGAAAMFVVLAVLAGMLINAAATFTQDIYGDKMRREGLSQVAQVKVARRAVLVIGVVMIIFAIAVMRVNTEFMLSFEVNLAASTILPVFVYNLFWKRFNTAGMLWCLYGGTAVAAILEFFGPEISGSAIPPPLILGASFNWFPWGDIGLVSVPVAFLLGYLGTRLSRERNETGFAEFEVRALTGAGSDQDEDIAQPALADRHQREQAVRE